MMGELIREALLLACTVTVVVIGCGTISSLCVAVLQAATQIQEQTSAFLIRSLTFAAALFISTPVFCPRVVLLMTRALHLIEAPHGLAW